MEVPSAAFEDSIDITSMKTLDLRSLAQDEIQCLAMLSGDIPARLQDLVNVMVDKSIFNESAGTRRQTFDRDRVPRNKDRRHSASSASAQLHLAIESAGCSHKDLILHLCRQLHISEKGDRALYQPQAAQPTQANRGMSLKRMARISFTGRVDSTIPLPSSAGNGKVMPVEALHRSSKKMKTKEEARRRAAESQAEAATGALESDLDVQDEKHGLKSSGGGEHIVPQDMPKHAGGMNFSIQAQSDLKLPEDMIRSTSAILEVPEMLKRTRGTDYSKPYKSIGVLCGTCQRSFSNMYSLRRHAAYMGHVLDKNMRRSGSKVKRKKKAVPKSSLRCSCGNTYATPFTLRRHAITNGHALSKAREPSVDEQQLESCGKIEVIKPEKHPNLGKKKLETFLDKHVTKFKCRHCLKRFIRKKHYIRHLDSHVKKTKKKMGRPASKPIGKSSDEVKSKRMGRPSKLDQEGHVVKLGRLLDQEGQVVNLGKFKRKRKREPESLDQKVRPRTKQDILQLALENIMSEMPVLLTCQECGKVFDEFSRYTGHLSMHSRLRKVYTGETNALANAMNTNFKEWAALGFRNLLNDSSGTFLSGLPAKLLFSKSSNERGGA